MDIKKLFILILALCFYNQTLFAETKSQLPLKISYEKCADQTFKDEYGRKHIDYLKKPLKVKLTSFSMNDEKVNQLLEESTVYIFCEQRKNF